MPKAEFAPVNPSVWLAAYQVELEHDIREEVEAITTAMQEVQSAHCTIPRRLLIVETDTPDRAYTIRYAALYRTLGGLNMLDAYFDPYGTGGRYETVGQNGWKAVVPFPGLSTVLEINNTDIGTRKGVERTTVHYAAA